MQPAQWFDDIAPGIPGQCLWLHADDGPRLRAGFWPAAGGGAGGGTVLLLAGRTEYMEKYARTIAALTAAGFDVASIDWRGQGLSDRLARDRLRGHVRRFADYQHDLAALTGALASQGMGPPAGLIGHSMGGAIGLRALHEGIGAQRAVFTGPMWAIRMAAWEKRVAGPVAGLARLFGLGHLRTPTTPRRNYVIEAPFEGNDLTADAQAWERMRAEIVAHPELEVAGPSLTWLAEALAEVAALGTLGAPPAEVLALFGEGERIVDLPAARAFCAGWPRTETWIVPGGRHEVLMEGGALGDRVHARLVAHLAGNPA